MLWLRWVMQVGIQMILLKDIDNLSIIKLPPNSPELDPVEQVWSSLRQHCLANRSVNGYEDIIDAFTDAWNQFVCDAQQVKRQCLRD